MLIRQTVSMCPKCYRRVPADIHFENNSIYMYKNCARCGQFTAMVERDPQFYTQCMASNNNEIYNGYLLDVTSRCNIACKYCYRGRDGNKDPCVDELLEDAHIMRSAQPIIITGGEPTLRKDLVDVVAQMRESAFDTTMLTNGVLLKDHLDGLIPLLATNARDLNINLSIHAESNGADIEILEHMLAIGHRLESVLFVIDDLQQIDNVVETCTRYKGAIKAARIKAASHLWAEHKTPERIYTSDMLCYMKKHHDANPMWWANNKVSFFNVVARDMHYMLICWYGIDNVDVLDIACPPYYKARTGQVENLVTACLINEGFDKGWLDGRRIRGNDG